MNRSLLCLHLSGVTPGEFVTQPSQRESHLMLRINMLTHNKTRWSAVLVLLFHVMPTPRNLAEALATAMLRGPFVAEALEASLIGVVGQKYPFVPLLVSRVVKRFGTKRRPRLHPLMKFLVSCNELYLALKKLPARLPQPIGLASTMQPIELAQAWQVKPLNSLGDAMEWLRLNEGEMLWLADPKSWEGKARSESMRNYRYRWVLKKNGGARLIESPKLLLKTLQRKVLSSILDHIPPHDAAHGFVVGRSIRTFAQPHVNREVVLRLDLRDFFVNIPKWRVTSVFLAAGYPEAVAVLLASLCVNATPHAVLSSSPAKADQTWLWRKRHASPHLPQGAPTSPALANLCAYHLDCRLAGLVRACGGHYTRYADDLVFSGDEAFARSLDRFIIQASAIAMEEGFQVNTRKTKVMRRSVSQRVAGVVINERLNVPRAEFDQLKAILHNCLKHGPQTQNRKAHSDFKAHLAGRVAHVCHLAPVRGQKLRDLLGRIDWH